MGSKIKEETVPTGTTNINFNTDGNYKIEAYPCKEDGSKAGESKIENFSIDTTPPNMPAINLLGTIGTNTWFKSEIQVTITPVNDMTSGIKGIQYYVEGDNPVTGTIDGKYLEVITENSTSINITADGKSIIHARTIDNAGNTSDDKTADAWKDEAPPPKVDLSLDSKTENSVTVTTSTSGTDETSGIAKYVFEYKTSTASTWTTAVEPVALPSTYTYTGLTPETAYNFRVTVVDNAGNENSTGTTASETTEAAGKEIDIADAVVGTTVNYTPDYGEFCTEIDGIEYSGAGKQTFTTNDLKGRVGIS